MASTWSSLKIELLETGQNPGQWGNLTNINLGDAVLGEAITGQATVDFASDADVTITLTDSATTQAARNLRLNITESSTGVGSVRNLILGSNCQIEKFYLINNTGTGAKTIKNTSGTGITVPAGKATLVFNNGTNVVDAASYFSSLTLGSALPVASGGTGLTAGTSGGVLGYTATGTLASSVALTANALVLGAGAGATPTPMASLGTTTTVLHGNASGAPTFGAVSLTADVTGTLPTANGGTNLTSFTSGGVVYASGTGTLATGSALQFNNTNEFKIVAATGTAYNRTESTQYSTFAQHFATSGGTGLEYKTLYRFVDTDVGELMRLTSTGLGIGTSSPAYKLDVLSSGTANNAAGSPSARFVGTNQTVTSESALLSIQSNSDMAIDTGGSVNFGGRGTTSSTASISYGHIAGRKENGTSGNFAGYLQFGTSDSGSDITERMRLDSAGNLGLGVTPSVKLDVSDSTTNVVKFTTSSGSDSTLLTLQGGSGVRVRIFPANGTTNYNWQLAASTNVSNSFEITPSTASGGSTFTAPVYTVSNAGLHKWFYGTTQAMTLDASGNLGVGTTSPSSFEGTVKTVIGGGSGNPVLTLYGGNATFSGIYFADGTTGNEKYRGFFEYDHASDALRIGTTGSTRATLDSAGNLGLGVTPSAWNSVATALQVRDTAIYSTTNATSLSTNNFVNAGGLNKYINTGFSTLYYQASGSHQWYIAPSGTAGDTISFTQALTLDANGKLFLGTTGDLGGVGAKLAIYSPDLTNTANGCTMKNGANSTGGAYLAFINYLDATIGSITQSTSTAVLYNTTSDQRLKENIQDADSASSLIDSLQVRQFDWKSDNSHQRYGFVAQELVTVAPEAVHQPADTEQMMAVDYSKLVPMLVKEIQSLRQRLSAANL